VRIVACPAPLLVACWTSAAPPPATTVTDASDGACVIRDREFEPEPAFELAIEGETFAVIAEKVLEVEVTVRDPGAARARLETDHVILEGELDLAGVQSVRPQVREHDGWVEISVAHVRTTRGGVATLAVPLPEPVVPPTLAIEVACSKLTLAPAPDDADEERDRYDPIVLRRGTTPLLRGPGGGVLARLVVRDGVTIHAQVLERRREVLKIEITDRNRVVGWIAAAAAEHPYREGFGGGGFGMLGSAAPPVVRCAEPVAVYVTTRSRGTVRVGSFKPMAPIQPTAHLATATTELPVELGSATLTPFVRVADLADCE
jgi:hypothetical protein